MKLLVVLAFESAFAKMLWVSISSFSASDIFCAIDEVGFNWLPSICGALKPVWNLQTNHLLKYDHFFDKNIYTGNVRFKFSFRPIICFVRFANYRIFGTSRRRFFDFVLRCGTAKKNLHARNPKIQQNTKTFPSSYLDGGHDSIDSLFTDTLDSTELLRSGYEVTFEAYDTTVSGTGPLLNGESRLPLPFLLALLAFDGRFGLERFLSNWLPSAL